MPTCTSLLLRVLPTAAVAGGAMLLTTGCQQPKINCMAAHGDFAAIYELKSGDPNSPCGSLSGDVLGMQSYSQEGGLNGTPDYNNSIVAIRPGALGELFIRALDPPESGGASYSSDEWYEVNSIGKFSAGLPNDDDFCMVPDFDVGAISLPVLPLVPAVPAVPFDPAIPDDPETEEDESIETPEIPEIPEIPATSISYTWSDARWVVSADAQGTQFEADLAYERDGCTAEYHVLGLYPAIGCDNDKDCNDDSNGINPDFAVRCEASIGMCVIAGPPPSYE